MHTSQAGNQGTELPPTMDLPEWSWLLRLVRVAERVSGLDGLASFLLAKAKQASDGVPSVVFQDERGAEVFRAHAQDDSYQRYFRTNPWWPGEEESERGLGMEDRWSFLGGWFGLPPVMALSTADGAGRRHDPSYVFMPHFAVAYATDLVVRLLPGLEAPSWADVWRRWSRMLPTVTAPSQAQGTFEDFLARTHRWGSDASIVERPLRAEGYPGFTRVTRQLQSSEPAAVDIRWVTLSLADATA